MVTTPGLLAGPDGFEAADGLAGAVKDRGGEVYGAAGFVFLHVGRVSGDLAD